MFLGRLYLHVSSVLQDLWVQLKDLVLASSCLTVSLVTLETTTSPIRTTNPPLSHKQQAGILKTPGQTV